MEILDAENMIKQRDPFDALGMAANEWEQLTLDLPVQNAPSEKRAYANIIMTGMGGSALSANLARDWLNLGIPFEVVRGYELPRYVGPDTLVIASSFSGNTEETLSALAFAYDHGATVAITASGGKLLEQAKSDNKPYVELPDVFHNHQRMGTIANLAAFINILVAHGVCDSSAVGELRDSSDWLRTASESWNSTVAYEQNVAKQLAWACAGKSPVIYAGSQFRGVAYKWKIGFNENAKTVAWWNELPEFNHNEFLGWASHPIEKPYAVIDLRSSFDHPQVKRRFEISDRLLSGQRPKATVVELQGESVLRQMLWGSVLGDFVSIYLAMLNGVNPTNVDLIEKLKGELAE
jgi:glucose/mannose-6-phosphate isomerase